LGQDDAGTARGSTGGEIDAVRTRAAQCDEGLARAQLARVEREAIDTQVAERPGVGETLQQRCERTRAHGCSSTGASSIGRSVGGLLPTSPSRLISGPPAYQRPMLSGGTSSRRSAPSITRANTGAETMPP